MKATLCDKIKYTREIDGTMATKASELNYDRYPNNKYDYEIKMVIPGHNNLHKIIETVVKRDYSKMKSIHILELGVGTGLTASKILRHCPSAQYIGIDFSEQMLKGARKRLKKYNSELILGDYAQVNFSKNNNLVVSVIGIHHQKTNQDKKNLFQKIYNSLTSDGAFLFGDLVTYRDKEEAALNDALHFHHLVENTKDEQSLKEWAHHHKFQNKLAALENQIDWLKEVGFRKVIMLYRKYNTALIYARK
ncbi:class I SAM-dependent methyltransferase [Candidatus Woesearchaeota archaeon]|nr:class I SAM-dependent methyltransferase [Candidatus Woesearchaeota archaeon]